MVSGGASDFVADETFRMCSAHWTCYASQQTYVEVNDTYSEGGTHKETLRPQSKAKVVNKRREDKVTIKQIADS